MSGTIHLREGEGGAGATCRSILDQLPTWFGIAEANEDYVRSADELPWVIASVEEVDVGITVVVTHSQWAAEVHLMAVAPALHRAGIGRAMLRRAEASLAAQGIEFLQVKTLSAAVSDEGYARTRAFWFASGFRPLEEFPTLWSPDNPALQMIKVIDVSM